jgi:hypothetical protein
LLDRSGLKIILSYISSQFQNKPGLIAPNKTIKILHD